MVEISKLTIEEPDHVVRGDVNGHVGDLGGLALADGALAVLEVDVELAGVPDVEEVGGLHLRDDVAARHLLDATEDLAGANLRGLAALLKGFNQIYLPRRQRCRRGPQRSRTSLIDLKH